MEGCVQIGQITKDPKTGKTRIERDWYRQGWVVKDEEAFLLHPDQQSCFLFSYAKWQGMARFGILNAEPQEKGEFDGIKKKTIGRSARP